MIEYSKVQERYKEDPDKCLSLDCMSSTLSLYDLSWDLTESHNLSSRFIDEREGLYKTLKDYSNSKNPIVEPKFFEDHNSEAKTEDNVWTPFIDTRSDEENQEDR